MNLIVDAGNSIVKIAIFNKGEFIKSANVSYDEVLEVLQEWLKTFTCTHAIVATVTNMLDEVVAMLNTKVVVYMLSQRLKLPFINNYGTPATLGQDRVALAAAAAWTYPNSNVLVIDAGTCVTYEFVNSKAEYKGGAIAPGLRMRLRAMHHFTAKLPEVSVVDLVEVVGNSTVTCMLSGAVNGMAFEIDGFITDYQNKYEDLTVILTGGDSKILSKRLKNGIFANSNFLLEGLNAILEHNKSE